MLRAADGVRHRSTGTQWLVDHAIDLFFWLVVLASVAYWYRITKDTWFFADEWPMAQQVGEARQILEPYNGHLSITILGLYRFLLEVFGFSTYGPYRLAGILSFTAVSVAMFVTTRRRVGPALAAAMALLLLWPRGMTLEAGGLNHSLALVGAIVCGYGLRGRGSRRDLVVAAGLAFALCSAGDGIAVAAAAICHTACTRGSVRRWVAVVVPTVAWVIWWKLVIPPDPEAVRSIRPGAFDLAGRAVGEARRSFAYLALGNRAAGVVLFVLFVGYFLWRMRQGLAAAANVVAWSVGLGIWWMGLEWNRWFTMEVFTFRYQFVSVGLILLALQPSDVPEPSDAEEPTPAAAAVPWYARPAPYVRVPRPSGAAALAALAGVVVLAGVLVVAVRPDAQDFARDNGSYGRTVRLHVDTTGVKGAIAPETSFGFYLGQLDATEVRRLVERFGPPPTYGDAASIVRRSARLEPGGRADLAPPGCTTVSDVATLPPDDRIELVAGPTPQTVSVRRFGSPWIELGRLDAHERAVLTLPGNGSTLPWHVRAPGSCALP